MAGTTKPMKKPSRKPMTKPMKTPAKKPAVGNKMRRPGQGVAGPSLRGGRSNRRTY